MKRWNILFVWCFALFCAACDHEDADKPVESNEPVIGKYTGVYLGTLSNPDSSGGAWSAKMTLKQNKNNISGNIEFVRGEADNPDMRQVRNVEGKLTYNDKGEEALALDLSYPVESNSSGSSACRSMQTTLLEQDKTSLPSSKKITLNGHWTSSNCRLGGQVALAKNDQKGETLLTIVIRAFLPTESVYDTDLFIPHPTLSNRTMLNVSSLGCYATDDRSFSLARNASARFGGEIEVNLSTGKVISNTLTGLTERFDCTTGVSECKTVSGINSFTINNVQSSADQITLEYEGEANNKCAKWAPSAAAPDIELNGKITINIANRHLTVEGLIDDFPAFEAYAYSYEHGDFGMVEDFTLFQVSPAVGANPFSLINTGASHKVRRDIIF